MCETMDMRRLYAHLTQLLFVSCALLELTNTRVFAINHECTPSGIIIVHDIPLTYVKVYAIQTDNTVCDVTRDSSDVIISNCLPDRIILLFLSEDPNTEIYDEKDDRLTTHVIQCTQISKRGVLKTLSNEFSGILRETSDFSVTVNVDVTMGLYEYVNDVNSLTSMVVGDDVYWAMDISAAYTLLPVKCTASGSGTLLAATPVTQQVTLIENGCSDNVNLSGDFNDVSLTIPGKLRYYTTLSVFQFFAYDSVTFSCQVKVCPAGSDACEYNCNTCYTVCERRRKRSSVPGIPDFRDPFDYHNEDDHHNNRDAGVYITSLSVKVAGLAEYSAATKIRGSSVCTVIASALMTTLLLG